MAKTYTLIFLFLLFEALPFSAEAATLSLSPASGSYAVGSTFSVNVFVGSSDQAANAASGVISYPSDRLTVTSISKTGSIFTLWVQEPSFSNADGSASFEGIILNPGFMGSSGKVLTITFRAKIAGEAAVGFSSGSVLANDGMGTNILTGMHSAQITIESGTEPVENSSAAPAPSPTSAVQKTLPTPRISSSTHPDPERWYQATTAQFSWSVPSGITAVRLLYGTRPNSAPTVVYRPPVSKKTIEDIPDGAYYFHVQFGNAAGWGPITHFRFNVDATPPETLTVTHLAERSTAEQAAFMVQAEDTLSGIDHYKMSIDESSPVEWSANEDGVYVTPHIDRWGNLFAAPIKIGGEHTLTVFAFDQANNASSQSVEFAAESVSWVRKLSSQFSAVLIAVVVALMCGASLGLYWWRTARKKKLRPYMRDVRKSAVRRNRWAKKTLFLLCRIALIIVSTPFVIIISMVREIYREILKTFAKGGVNRDKGF